MSQNPLGTLLENKLAERAAGTSLRKMRAADPAGPGFLMRGGRKLVDFSSNDYLGLAGDPLLAERSGRWAERLGTGARASRLVTGTLQAHLDIEAKIAALKGSESALLFASGWQANAAIFPALLGLHPETVVFTDKLIHASIHHGIAASGKRQTRFRHNDLAHLEAQLKRCESDMRLIVTESIFSMDGDLCDVRALVKLARKYGAFLVVDEAHATGVFGAQGGGLCADLDEKPDLVMGTFSKAMGSFGAYIAGSAQLRDYLVNMCSGFIYSTALPPPVLGAIDAALDLVPDMDGERLHLQNISAKLRAGLNDLGFDTGASASQIVPLILKTDEEVLTLAGKLEERGMLGIAIRPPTVPAGSSRIRFALSSAHKEAQIDKLIEILREIA